MSAFREVPRPVRAVRVVPEGTRLAHSVESGRVELTVPRVDGHCMIEISF